ncbi:unnamed protein product [Litomosoides sigmodontis]|uniref:Uncharacterized protein n=1 Tax=Litomosoides sigmodontis TaxID=42156 RepID=A0A3P6TDA4_LITSI|nr:unnamed protein product [Litomosoides sigmodontis]
MGSWRVSNGIRCYFYLAAIARMVLATCPISSNIPPPVCALLFTDNECLGRFSAVTEDSQEMELDQLWDNRITLAIIRPDCFLDLYDGANVTDTHRLLGGEISEGNIYDLSHYAFANRTSSYICRCNGFW